MSHYPSLPPYHPQGGFPGGTPQQPNLGFNTQMHSHQDTYPPSGAPGYPPSGASAYHPSGAPGYPPSGASGFTLPSAPGYPPSGAPGYPSSSVPGYPPSGPPGYPPTSAPGYPSSGAPGYPPSSAPGYPPSGASGFTLPSAPGYPPSSAPGYPPSSNPGYPLTSAPGYPPSGAPAYPPSSAPGYPPPGAHEYPSVGSSRYPAPPLPGSTPYPGVSVPSHQLSGYGSANAHHVPFDANRPKQCTPTVRPKVPYGPAEEEADAAALRKAMKGFGTDERAIINILANRTNHQRQLIARRFAALYGKDLIKNLKSELSGDFENLVVACMTPLDQFYAKELHTAMAGLGTNEDTLIEILCTQNNAWIHAIKNSYQMQFRKPLESDIRGDTSGYFERLLLSLCQAMRDESPYVNPSQVATDVQALYLAGEKRIGTDEVTFNGILATRSLLHLREVFRHYHATHRKSFENVIKSEFSGSIKSGLLAIVTCMTDSSSYFAERLHRSMYGAGTNDRALIRLIVTRSEIDLANIKITFQQKYGRTLESFIEGDCSGDYKKMLLAMVTSRY